tara:strand:+ start:4064 stop:4819 length:756 start_codon:yes stop_codon:yes gene_type:complete
MDLQIKDMVALVTGASVGIGTGIVKVLADEGCKLIITARRDDLLNGLADEVEAAGHDRPLVVTQDLTADDAGATLKKVVDDAHGRLDILVNNAGAMVLAPVGTDEQVWIDIMNLKWWAALRMSELFVPGMIERGYGRVINITGTMEPFGINAATCANAAIQAWSKGLSREHSKDGVTSNCIIPGRIHSEQNERGYPTVEDELAFAAQHIPAGEFGDPEDVANLVAFVASPKARMISGSVMYVDGGMKRFAH